jgi:hypothetical protein
MAYSVLDFCTKGRGGFKFTFPPTVASISNVYPVLSPYNVSEAISIGNFIGLTDCPDHEVISKAGVASSLMWSNKVSTLSRKILETWQASFMSGYDLSGKETAFKLHFKPGTGSARNEAGSILSGGDHVDYFEAIYKKGGYLAGPDPTYTDFMYFSFLRKSVFPIFGRKKTVEALPSTFKAIESLHATHKSMFAEVDKYPWLPTNAVPPLDAQEYSPTFVSNFIRFWEGTEVYVLYADREACPFFGGDDCKASATAFSESWFMFIDKTRASNPDAQFVRADKDACSCACKDCGREVCNGSCNCEYQPTIKVFKDSSSWMHPGITSASEVILDKEKWVKL